MSPVPPSEERPTGDPTPAATPTRKNVLLRFIDWLRVGYPTGMSDTDANALLFVLHHQLTDADAARVSREIVAHERSVRSGETHTDASLSLSDADIAAYIRRVMVQKPTPEDIAKVKEALTAAGFQLPETTSAQP